MNKLATTSELIEHFKIIRARAEAGKHINNFNRMVKNGVVVRKGAALNRERIKRNLALYEIYGTFFSVYPDLFLDLIKPINSSFKLFFYQRIFLRACMRYRRVYTTAPRALIEE